MVRELITIKDYEKISKDNEYFIWNFISKKEQSHLEIYSYFKEYGVKHELKALLDLIDIPYFESYTEDSFDFLVNLEINPDGLWTRNIGFNPVLVGFNKKRKITSTLNGHCYCKEGILDLILDLNPKFILDCKLD